MEVLVFKTNINSPLNTPLVASSLSTVNGVSRWNVDFGDRDFVLRVEAEDVTPAEIVRMMASAGFECEELP